MALICIGSTLIDPCVGNSGWNRFK